MKAIPFLIFGSVLAVSAGSAEKVDAPEVAIAKLARTGEVSCQPAMPVFCSNIHVSCSGPSATKAFPFKLRATSTRGSLESKSDAAGMTEQFESGRVEWGNENGYVILYSHQTNGYVKMLADGRYSFRHYSQYAATMSRGHCD